LVLKECDVNKDIEIDGLAQITLPDMQKPLVERALRGYVKPIDEGKAYYRFELALAPNQPIEMARANQNTNHNRSKYSFFRAN